MCRPTCKAQSQRVPARIGRRVQGLMLKAGAGFVESFRFSVAERRARVGFNTVREGRLDWSPASSSALLTQTLT